MNKNLNLLIQNMEKDFDRKLTQTVNKLKSFFEGKLKDLEKNTKADGQKYEKLNILMNKTESQINKLNERDDDFSKTVELLKASIESKKQIKKTEELEMKLATVVTDMRNKALSDGDSVSVEKKIDQIKKN